MSLTNQDRSLLSSVKHVQLPFGVVAILNFNQPFPSGWERLDYSEAASHLQQLKGLLSQWSVVAFQQGKLDGFGYGSKYSETYGQECGQGFILKRGAHL